MNRPLIFAALLAAGSLARPVAAQVEATATPPAATSAAANGLPARPVPFKFVNDQAGLLTPANVKQLESGLRRYADQNGTQVVVVTVPSLGGRTAADYGRALGTAWGVGQRAKNNGVVVLVAARERKVAIEAGSGLSDKITAAVKQRVITQDFGPSFKQNNYFVGLRKGLNELMKAANPGSALAASGAAAANAPATAAARPDNSAAPGTPLSSPEPARAAVPAEPASSGPGIGTLLLGALGLGAVVLLLKRLFGGNKSAAQTSGQSSGNNPNFYPNQPNQPGRPNQQTPNFGAPQGPGGYGQAPQQGGGMMGGGMGGILATGAAAAAGAYLGNRLGGSHDAGSAPANFDNNANNAGLGAAGAGAAGAAGTGAAGDYFSSRDGSGTADNAPDYFSDANTADTSGDYFSSDDNSSYDDTSSSDTGGGGFDDSGSSGDDSGSF